MKRKRTQSHWQDSRFTKSNLNNVTESVCNDFSVRRTFTPLSENHYYTPSVDKLFGYVNALRIVLGCSTSHLDIVRGLCIAGLIIELSYSIFLFTDT